MGSTWGRLLGWRLGFGLGVLLPWEVAAGRWLDPFWFSSPLRIARHLADWTREGSLVGHLVVSALKVGVPFMAASRAASRILILMVCVMLFNGVLNRLERYVLRWRPRERMGAAREQQ